MLNRNEGVEVTSAYALAWKTFANHPANRQAAFVNPGSNAGVVFKENSMQLFITPEVEAGAKARLPNLKMWGATATRARFFRKALSRVVKQESIKQVICLGAGLDTTAVEKNKPSYAGVRFFEIDKQDVLAYKARVLLRHNKNQNAEYIALDYVQDNLMDALKSHGVNFNEPTMVLWEGNIFYLSNAQVLTILRQLAQAFPHLTVTLDFMHSEQEVEQSRDMVAALTGFEKAKSPFRSFFDPRDLVAACEEMGISLVERKTGADLAREYELDTDPYPTTAPYSLAVFKRG